MSDYYSILGVPQKASLQEIKRAYRILAKQYHPDIKGENGNHIEKFRELKQAYETLSNPKLKASYDEKFQYGNTQVRTQKTESKNRRERRYDFSEEAMKRRRYYQEMYGAPKKQNFKSGKDIKTEKKESPYKEFHFILISIPIAVALLLLVIYKYDKPVQNSQEIDPINKMENKPGFRTSSSPLLKVFGEPFVDRNSLSVLKTVNRSGFDAIVCLQNLHTHQTVRHYYIENNFELFYEYIPKGDYVIKFALLKNENISDTAALNLSQRFFHFQQNQEDTLRFTGLKTENYTRELKVDSSYSISKEIFLSTHN